MTYQEAAAKLPADAKWSASFGEPGNGGYREYHRDRQGRRYVIANGEWSSRGEEWTFTQLLD